MQSCAGLRGYSACIATRIYLFPYLIKYLNAFVDFFQSPVNFCLELAVCTHSCALVDVRTALMLSCTLTTEQRIRELLKVGLAVRFSG